MRIWEYTKGMKKIFISAAIVAGVVVQGFFAVPALAAQYNYPGQAYNYSGYAYPSSQFPQYQYPQYQYPSYNQYPYNYNYQYGYQNCYNGYSYNCYPYNNNYNYGYNYPPSITGVSGPTQLMAGQTGTWSVQVANYPYGASYNSYLSYTVSWGDENINPYTSAYNAGAVNTGTLSHTYIRPGTYTIRITVTNAWGRSTSASATVYVSQGCNYQYGYPYNNNYQYGYGGYSNCYPYPYVY